jgi:MOSC domain-containing protein YiiM
VCRHAQRTSRTGWVYRVLQPGPVAIDDPITVVERLLQVWTLRTLREGTTAD